MVEVTGSSPVRPTHSLRSFVGLGALCLPSGGRFADGPRSLRSLRRSSSAGAFGWLSSLRSFVGLGALCLLRGPLHGASSLRCGFQLRGCFRVALVASLIRGPWGAVSSAGAVARSVLASLRLSASRVLSGGSRRFARPHLGLWPAAEHREPKARIATAGGEAGKSVVPGVVGPVGVALF